MKICEDTALKINEDGSMKITVHDEFTGETSSVFLEKETFEAIKKKLEEAK